MICISGSPLFYLPSTGYVKILLEFLIQHNSFTKSNKKVSFHAVSYCSLLVEWKKHKYYGSCMGTNFSSCLHSIDFASMSHAMRNWWENPCISHMMKYTTGWKSNEKNTHTMETVWVPISEAFLIRWVLLPFPMLWEIDEKIHAFPHDEVYYRMRIYWEKSSHTMGKVWVPISQFLSMRWVLLDFPLLWEINGETHSFSIWWSIR